MPISGQGSSGSSGNLGTGPPQQLALKSTLFFTCTWRPD